MHVFAGEILSLPRGSNGENLECVGGGGEHRGKEQAESSTTRAHRRSFPLSRSLYLHHPTYESRPYLVSPYIKLSLTRWLPLLILPLSRPPANGPSHEWSKEEMCLCLDSRQIICGNKFLCV